MSSVKEAPSVALGPKRTGYHFAHSPDGALVAELNEPCADFTTVTWMPDEIEGKRIKMQVPTALFDAVVRSYYLEFSAKKT